MVGDTVVVWRVQLDKATGDGAQDSIHGQTQKPQRRDKVKDEL